MAIRPNESESDPSGNPAARGSAARFVSHVLNSHVPDVFPPVTVARCLVDAALHEKYGELLRDKGIALAHSRSGPRRDYQVDPELIFFDVVSLRRSLLRNTPWQYRDPRLNLEDLEGATRYQRQMGSRRPWGFQVSAAILEQFVSDSSHDPANATGS